MAPSWGIDRPEFDRAECGCEAEHGRRQCVVCHPSVGGLNLLEVIERLGVKPVVNLSQASGELESEAASVALMVR